MPGSVSGFQGFCEIFCLGSTFFLVLFNQFQAIPCLHPSKFKETSVFFWQVKGVQKWNVGLKRLRRNVFFI